MGPGRWQATDATIEPTRYRTELGAALRYTMQAREARTAKTEALPCYLKVYRNQQGASTFQLLRSLAGRAGSAPYAVVRPIVYLGELHTLVLEEAPGAFDVWQVYDQKRVVRIQGDRNRETVRSVLANDGSILATGNDDGTVQLWKIPR